VQGIPLSYDDDLVCEDPDPEEEAKEIATRSYLKL